jgi:hypothetical protein
MNSGMMGTDMKLSAVASQNVQKLPADWAAPLGHRNDSILLDVLFKKSNQRMSDHTSKKSPG